MRRRPILAAFGALCVLSAWPADAGPPTEVFRFPGVGQVSVYAPMSTPSNVVLFVSGDGGWNLGVIPMAETLRDRGALVVGIDVRAFLTALGAAAECAYPAGSLEELSRAVQLRRRLPEYKRPILVGYSSGATLVYAALAAAPPDTFAGAISLGFCPYLEINHALCQQRGLVATRRTKGAGYDLAPDRTLQPPWMVLQGEVDQVCAPQATRAFVAAMSSARLFSLPNVGHGFGVTRNWEAQYIEAYRAIGARPNPGPPAASAPEVRDLDLIEVIVPTSLRRDAMAIILTGDGGWSELDKEVADGLAAHGIPAVGWSSLRYYWTARTPEMAAADLARILRYYASAWIVNRVVLVGYSFGADVLPFLVNRLPADVATLVHSVVLLGLSPNASFEFRLSSWFGGGGEPTYLTAPEVERLSVPVTCVHGVDERDSACLALKGAHVTSAEVGRGHHFSGDYASLVEVILGAGGRR